MATTTLKFPKSVIDTESSFSSVAELWSEELVNNYKAHLTFPYGRPQRDPATQALRDAALGHKEFPDGNMTLEQLYDHFKEIQHNDSADALQYALNYKIVDTSSFSSATVATGTGAYPRIVTGNGK